MLAGGKINARNIKRIPKIDKLLIVAIPVEDMSKQESKTIHKF
jgi:hypothetical protein